MNLLEYIVGSNSSYFPVKMSMDLLATIFNVEEVSNESSKANKKKVYISQTMKDFVFGKHFI